MLFSVFTVVLPKSFSALISGPVTIATSNPGERCVLNFDLGFDFLIEMAVHHVDLNHAAVH